mmetsp:Transcript_45972/g.33730  ORF Transcript_45972/g.33730 Transcript_45972/m.33730 type:complete len:143 (+) Transcript_45972:107-535(+)
MLLLGSAFGQFVSRSNSSLVIMNVPFSMAFLQILNLLLVLIAIFVFNFQSFYVMLLFSCFVGYVSGSVYLNTFFIITKNRYLGLPESIYNVYVQKMQVISTFVDPVTFEDQEIALNIALIGLDLGFFLSSCLGFLFDLLFYI